MTPASPGNATAVASAKVSGARKGGAKSACAKDARSSSGPTEPARRRALERGRPDARGLEHGAREVRLEGHRGALLEKRAEDLVAGVRVDAPLARRRDRRSGIEPEAGRVGEQVAHRRAGRAGRLVEVEDPFLGGDEDGAGGRELRDRRPPRRARRRRHAPRARRLATTTATDACGAGQSSIAASAPHATRYYRRAADAHLVGLALRAHGGLLPGCGRRRPHLRRRNGAGHARRSRSARRLVRPDEAVPRDHRRPRSPRRARAWRMSCGRGSTSSMRRSSTGSPEPTARRSPRCARRTRRSS